MKKICETPPEKRRQEVCVIGTATLVIVIYGFLVGPHNAASKGVIALVMFLAICYTMLGQVVDCWKECSDRPEVLRKIAEYFFALCSTVIFGIVIGWPAASYLFGLWVFGLGVMFLKYVISQYNGPGAMTDRMFGSGMPMG